MSKDYGMRTTFDGNMEEAESAIIDTLQRQVLAFLPALMWRKH